jgi:hypothetical protein
VVGLTLAGTGLWLPYSWLDLLIGGAIFGAVVGAAGGALTGAVRGALGFAAARWAVAGAAVLGAVIGGAVAEFAILGIFGLVGGLAGGRMWREDEP